MATPLEGNILRLHNELQFQGRAPRFEWQESSEGPLHDCMWISVLRVDGQVMGTGQGRRKQVARDIAAGHALTHLGFNDPENNPQENA
ncbi:hypothetical protein FRC08_008676 [Ceratobasidium sp. 394]|nr:hypothetical protein FRC08_008676 [Ceratobasidium sp. 394]KAG9100697.1 hypothetical protein FS749_013568 [Ceratobasidium sp. UAMH 11750]